ncbi:HNH endonuclease family protein [Mycobacterium sp.]|uniref:HNH endonuclease family protein n=1 Tax=Mycobacterium sp. TaxID=1785 RepID=UPI003D6BBB9A
MKTVVGRPPAKKWPWVVGAIAALLLIGIGVLDPAGPADQTAAAVPGTTSTPAPIGSAAVAEVETDGEWATALARLNTLAIKGRAPKTGYSRAAFGPAWSDDVNVEDGHNGCDTRNDMLRRDLTDITVKSNGCVVLSGILNDPYTGTAIPFQRGAKTSTAVQIDHVVALEDAWQKGAQQLDAQTRQNFANDPADLQATDGPTNEKKGSADAATWLPPNKSYRCTYVSRQVFVKSRYGLWVTQAEHDAIANLLTGCGATAP